MACALLGRPPFGGPGGNAGTPGFTPHPPTASNPRLVGEPIRGVRSGDGRALRAEAVAYGLRHRCGRPVPAGSLRNPWKLESPVSNERPGVPASHSQMHRLRRRPGTEVLKSRVRRSGRSLAMHGVVRTDGIVSPPRVPDSHRQVRRVRPGARLSAGWLRCSRRCAASASTNPRAIAARASRRRSKPR